MSLMSKYELDESTFVIKAAKFRHFVDEDGMPWFVAKDVCAYLKIADVSDACERVWPEYRRTEMLPTIGTTARAGSLGTGNGMEGSQAGPERNMIVVNEPGLYQLIFMSRKEEAVGFQRWVFEEVLPKLRRYGYYEIPGRGAAQRKAAKAVTRFGRQPFLDEVKRSGFSVESAIRQMNELPLDDVPKLAATVRGQFAGEMPVQDVTVARACQFLKMPVEQLFNSWRQGDQRYKGLATILDDGILAKYVIQPAQITA